MKIPKFLTSSVDSERLALTVKGLIVGAIPLILVITGAAHISLGQADLTIFADSLANIIIAFSTLASALMVMVGVIRKIAVGLGLVK